METGIQWKLQAKDTLGPTIVERMSSSRRFKTYSMGIATLSALYERLSLSRSVLYRIFHCSVNISVFHAMLSYSVTTIERSKLDRRRLEAAHFKYAILNVMEWYSETIKEEVIFCPDMNKTLLQFTPRFQLAFHKKYSGMSLLF